MHLKTGFFLMASFLLFCAFGCASRAPEPAAPTDAPAESMPYRSAARVDEPSGTDERVFATSLYDAGTNDFDGERLWTVAFDGLSTRTVDRRNSPARFDGDYSVWMTYDRDGDWDNCTLGRCIDDEADWNLLSAVLFSRTFVPDANAEVRIQTPRFLIRKGTLCLSSTSYWDIVGKTYYIDDEVCTYWINPDGSVIRTAPDEVPYRSEQPLTAEEAAYLYLLYEAHYMTATIQCPSPAYPEEQDQYRLLVEKNGVCTELPRDRFEAFTALVTVPEDQTPQSVRSCFACTTEMFANADYPSSEVLRFRFVQDGYDPDQSPQLWFSLREDGRIIRETPLSAGFIHAAARWRCFGKNRFVSVARFPVDEILRFVSDCGAE